MTLKERLLARERERAAAEAAAKAATEAKTDEAAKTPEEPATEVSTTNETIVGLEDFSEEQQQGYILSAYDDAVNQALETITFKETYERLSKGVYERGHEGRTGEGVKILCPNPGHPDKTPSAWIKTTEGKGGVGFCSWKCGTDKGGFDKFDVAAWAYGYSVPSYKHTRAFYEVNCRMALELRGIRPEDFEPTLVLVPAEDDSDKEEADVDENEDESKEEHQAKEEDSAPTQVTTIEEDATEKPEENSAPPAVSRSVLDRGFPTVDMEKVVPGGTDFITTYCAVIGEDTLAPVYNLACSLLLVSCATGLDVQLKEGQDVFGNIAIVLTGNTGAGKTRAARHCTKVLRAAFGEDPSKGYLPGDVRIIKDPGSDEYLVDQHVYEILGPTGGRTGVFKPVRSLVQFNELSKLMSKSRQVGSTLMERMFDFLDTEDPVETGSRGHGKVVARNAYASLLTTTQPDRLRKLFTGDDASFGVGNRLNFIFGGEVDAKLVEERVLNIDHSRVISKLIELRRWITDNLPDPLNPPPIGEPLYLKWSAEALDLVNTWGDSWLKPRTRRDESSLLNRLPLQVKKYSLLFAINDMSLTLEVCHVERAIEFIKFLAKCYALVNTKLAQTDDIELQDRVLEIIDDLTKKGKSVTHRLIFDRMKGRFGGDAKKLDQLLKSLVSLGVIASKESQNKRGPKTDHYGRA